MAALSTETTPTTLTPERLASDPVEFARRLLWILDKRKRLRRLQYNAAQLDYLKNRTRFDLILKPRQLGFSTQIQADFFRLAITRTVGTLTLAHDDDLTQRLRRMADLYYEKLPEPRPKRRYANASITTYSETHSEAAIGTAGSLEIGRGFTLTHFHGSEVAFWRDPARIMAGAMQSGDPAVVLESTANGAQGYFYDKCMEAMDGNTQFRLHFYTWWWEPQYRTALDPGETLDYTDEERALAEKHGLASEQIKWRRNKIRELKHLFLQEYPEDPITCFLLSGDGYFGDMTKVRRVPLGSLTPDPAHRYFAGLDFAQTVDWLALSIVDRTAGAEVEVLRLQRLPWKEMRRRVIERLKYWGVDICLAEENSMGSTNIEAMEEELRAADCYTVLVPFKTDHASKAQIMSALHEGMHAEAIAVLDDSVRLKELRAFQSNQTATGLWTLGAPSGGHDDTVIALALAWKAANDGAALAPRLIYGTWSEYENVTTDADYNPNLPVYWAVDDGYEYGEGPGTASYHPRVVLIVQDNALGGLDVVDEYVACEETHDATLTALLGNPDGSEPATPTRWQQYRKPSVVYAPSEAALFKGEIHRRGLSTVNGTHRVTEGIKAVRALIAQPDGARRLRVHPRCSTFIYEMSAYRSDPKGRSDTGEVVPLKQDDHTMDACRYLVWKRRHTTG